MKRKTKQENKAVIAKPMSDVERQLFEAFIRRNERASELPVFKKSTPTIPGLSGDENTGVSWERICALLKSDHRPLAGWTISTTAVTGILSQAADASFNLTLQQFDGMQPQSYLETMLIAQMIQVSNAATKCLLLAFQENQTTPGKELNANLATKFQRTLLLQIEALQKLRGKGGQRVTVEHVHVNQGGQAIVGNIEQGGKNGK